LYAGQPVYATNVSQFTPASADHLSKTRIIGLVMVDTLATFIAQANREALTLADWTIATGAQFLTPGAQYWLSTTSGMLTKIAPTMPGQSVVAVGRAVTSITMEIEISSPILL
jgi:hypothetical protein